MPRQVLLLGLLDFPEAAKGTPVLHFDKNIRSASHFFLTCTSDRQRAQVKHKNVCKSNGVTRFCEVESTYYVTSISVRKIGAWAFFSNPVFNHFPFEDFSQTNENRLVSAPRAHFRQKLKIDK